MYADMLEAIIPDFREDAPLERHLIEQRFWMMSENAHTGVHYRSDAFNEERPNRYTIIRSQFDKWFSRKVREAGALVLTETTALELIFDAYGACVGVRTDREGGIVHADVVVLAEGVNGLLGSRAGLREPPKPETVALAVKEMHFLPQETIEARFNVKGDEGVVIEAAGAVSQRHDRHGLRLHQQGMPVGRHRLPRLRLRQGRRDALRAAREVQGASVGQAAARRLRGQGILPRI